MESKCEKKKKKRMKVKSFQRQSSRKEKNPREGNPVGERKSEDVKESLCIPLFKKMSFGGKSVQPEKKGKVGRKKNSKK